MTLSTIGLIATHILENLNNVPNGVSGNMVEITDMARQHVANFTGENIGSNSIDPKFQPAITDFAKADTIDFIQAQGGGDKVTLEELSIDDSGDLMSAEAYRKMGEMKLKLLGRNILFDRSLS